MTHSQTTIRNQRGSAFLLTLFFSSLFIVMFGATLSFILVQHKAVQQEIWLTQALMIAEAGTQYYRWHLAHDPDDFTSDTGTHDYNDPQGSVFGQFTLDVTPPESGSTVATITTQGATSESPDTQARVRVRYGQPTIAQYALITNSNIWFGEGEEVKGQFHSNGGIRMDGEGNSLTTSAQETYICGPEHGCNNEVKDGIWGTGEIQELWEFPVEAIDFNSILLNLEEIKTAADTDGISLGDSESYGYYVVFNNDGTLTINSVTAVYSAVRGYNGTSWVSEAIDKRSWTPLAGYQNIPIPDNGVIFLQDDVWVSGTLDGRATVVAARLPDGSYPRADIYIQDDITYVARDGTNALALVAQQDLLAPLRSEDVLEINAALVAINGHVFRYYYAQSSREPNRTYALRDKIEVYGIIITNTVWTWSWVNSAGTITSGYENTETTYDPDLTYGPPPYFPTEDEYAFISWEELTLDQD